MGGVRSSSLSVERLQGAEVVSAQLRISGGSRPAELSSDGLPVTTSHPQTIPRVLPSRALVPLHATLAYDAGFSRFS